MSNTYVGLHVSKCAGTSFLEMAIQSLAATEFYQNTSMIRNWKNGWPEFFDIQDYASLRLVWGHSVHEQMLHYLQRPILFTGLRDPAKRLLSNAKFQVKLHETQGRKFDVETWLANEKNPMCWFIINRFPTFAAKDNQSLTPFERARNALTAFDYVFFTENFTDSATAILRELGSSSELMEKNKTSREDIDIELDLSNLKYDFELYEWARNTFANKEFSAPLEPNSLVQDFLSASPKLKELEGFLFNSMANEYSGWGVLKQQLQRRHDKAMQILREVAVYKKKLH